MKRLVSMVIATALVFSLCGCEAKLPQESAAVPEAAAEQEIVSASPDEVSGNALNESGASGEAGGSESSGSSSEEIETADARGEFDPDFRFSTTDRNGAAYDENVFAGQTLTMINFWEPWCGPCVSEMPDLEKLYQAYKDRGFLILGVYSTPDMEEDVDAVLEQTGVTYPILHYTEAFEAFDSGFVPTTIFVDGEGHILRHSADPEIVELLTEYESDAAYEKAETLFIGGNDYAGWETVVQAGLQ